MRVTPDLENITDPDLLNEKNIFLWTMKISGAQTGPQTTQLKLLKFSQPKWSFDST